MANSKKPSNSKDFVIESFYNDPGMSTLLYWGSKSHKSYNFAQETVLMKYKGKDEVVYVPDDVEVISSYAFNGNMNVKKVVIPDSARIIMPYAFRYCFNLEEVVIEGYGLGSIGSLAFAECCNLKTINFPQSLRCIEDCAFNLCVSLEEIELPDGLTRLGEAAFLGCQGLRQVHFPRSLTAISPLSFSQAITFDIPDWVTTIEAGAFDWNWDSYVFLPKSIKRIGQCEFDSADMKTIYYEGSEEEWKAIEIDNTDDWMKNITVKFNRKRGEYDEYDD